MELILIIWRISTSMFRTLLDNQAFSERDQIRATFLPTKMNFCRPVSEREMGARTGAYTLERNSNASTAQ